MNMNNLVGFYLHRPMTPQPDFDVLYRRVSFDEYNDRKLNNEIKYRQYASKVYNSPDNIRRLIISDSNILVQYYRPIKGLENKGTIFSYATSLAKCAERKKIFAASGCNGYRSMQKVAQKHGINLEEWKGFGLKSLVYPWVAQNIEEIYFDYTILSCIDGERTLEDYSEIMMDDKNAVIKQLFKTACNVDDESITVKFPRLRVVGCILNLSEKIDEIKEYMYETRNEYCVPTIIEKIQGESVVVYGAFALNSMGNKFSCKENLYLYDRECLSDLESLITSQFDKRKTEKQNNVKSNKINSSLICMLEHLNRVCGQKTTLNLIKSVYENTDAIKNCTEEEKEYINNCLKTR